MSRAATPLFASASRTVAALARHQSSGSCSAQPGRGVLSGYSAAADPRVRPSSSMTRVLVPDVPISMPSSGMVVSLQLNQHLRPLHDVIGAAQVEAGRAL